VEPWADRALAPRVAAAPRVALVNNAGTLDPIGPASRLSLADLDAHLRLNLTTPTWLAGFVLRHASRTTPVRVVNLSSGAATQPYPGWSAYCAGKAGLQMSGEVLAAEQEAYGASGDLAVVSYAPHVVATAMQAQLRATEEAVFPLRQRFVDLHEGGELVDASGPAAEIADLCAADGLPAHTTARFAP
jgi:benzil reductase ((S)-benzoin forming)